MHKSSIEFPLRDTYTDCAGVERHFVIAPREILPKGFLLVAREDKEGVGYEFEAYSPAEASEALGLLRKKIHRALATKYLVETPLGFSFSHDELKGSIAHNGLVIDGRLVSFAEAGKLLATHEGWSIEIKVIEPDA